MPPTISSLLLLGPHGCGKHAVAAALVARHGDQFCTRPPAASEDGATHEDGVLITCGAGTDNPTVPADIGRLRRDGGVVVVTIDGTLGSASHTGAVDAAGKDTISGGCAWCHATVSPDGHHNINFTDTARLECDVDIALNHAFEGVRVAAEGLFAALVAVTARSRATAGGTHDIVSLLLRDHVPYVQAASVRPPLASLGLRPLSLAVGPGTGEAGDIIVGDVVPRTSSGAVVSVFQGGLVDSAGAEPPRHGFAHDGDGFRVLAPLGTRESITHAGGAVPTSGWAVGDGAMATAWWLGVASGLVGGRDDALVSDPPAQAAVSDYRQPLYVHGLLQYPAGHARAGQNVNVSHLAAVPVSATEDAGASVSVPVVCVAGSSDDAGTGMVASAVVRVLRARMGIRAAAVTATGSGDVSSRTLLRGAGAKVVLDHLDAGLASTHAVPAPLFRERAAALFHAAASAGADVIVAELGDDIAGANNGTLLSMPALCDAISRGCVLGIAADPMAAVGLRAFARSALPAELRNRMVLVASPHRNATVMAARVATLGLGRMRLVAPDDDDALVAALERMLDADVLERGRTVMRLLAGASSDSRGGAAAAVAAAPAADVAAPSPSPLPLSAFGFRPQSSSTTTQSTVAAGTEGAAPSTALRVPGADGTREKGQTALTNFFRADKPAHRGGSHGAAAGAGSE